MGASYGGALGVTSTSGPGLSLKSEALGLAVMTELPLIVIDVQRGGPSTGLPTKTEQSDLLQATVRPQRRVAGGRAGAAVAVGLLRRGPRGGAHRGVVPHPGDHLVRRRDRQRLRTVADPGRRGPCNPFSTPSPSRTSRSAVRPRPGDARPPVRHARHARARAPHRRAGIRERIRRHLLRAGQPRPDGAVAPSQDRRHLGSRSRSRRSDRRRRTAADRLGQLLRSDRRGLPARAAQRHQGRPRTPAPSALRSRPTWARCCGATRRWCARR